MSKKLIFSLFLLVHLLVLGQNTSSYKTEYVIILVIDGPRYSETFGDSTCKYVPRMCSNLKHEGTFYSNFRNNGPTYTISGHTAMTTGVYQKISNNGDVLPKNPSFFQYYLKEKSKDKTDAYIVASKGKLEVIGNTKAKGWWNLYTPYTYCGPYGNGAAYGSDAKTFQKAEELLSSVNPPHLLLINLLAVDNYGHANQWEKYLKSIERLDQYADQLWKSIQSNPKLANKTTLFITNDHGRHLDGKKDGFVSHGDGCEGCRHISLLVLGPDTKKGVEIKEEGELIDISATIAHLLQFSMPTSKGRILKEMLK